MEEVEEEKMDDEEKVEDGYGGGNSWSETHGISSIDSYDGHQEDD